MKLPILVSHIVILVSLASIAGCGESVPKCSDDNTVALVKTIMSQQIAERGDLTEAEVNGQLALEYARASSFDSAIKKYECEAKLIAAGAYQVPITYESQIDDKGEHIVAVSGISPGDLYQMVGATAAAAAESKERAAKKQASTEQPKVPSAIPRSPPASDSVNTSRVPAGSVPQRTVPPPTRDSSHDISTVGVDSSPDVSREASSDAPARTEPSFDCNKASTLVETSICGDDELARKDARLARIYLSMMAAEVDTDAKTTLKSEQRDFLMRRNECSSNQCLRETYSNRLQDICELAEHQECQ